MPVLEIDGIGRVEVGAEFLAMSPDKQASEVEAIAATIKGGQTPPALTDEQEAINQINARQAPTDDLAKRGALIPAGRTQEGELVPALPEFIEGPRRTIMDLLEGKRTAQQISGKEIFDLGLLFGGGSPAAGTGAGIARAASEATPEALRAMSGPGLPGLRPRPSPAATEAVAPAAVPAVAVAPAGARPALEAAAAPMAEAMTTAELKTAAKSFYKKADDAGVVIKPESLEALASDIGQTIAKEGFDGTLHPRSFAAIKRVAEAREKPVPFSELEAVRRVVNAAGRTMDKDDGRIAGIMKDKIDDFIAGLSEKDIVAGDAKAVSGSIVKARELWSKVAKLETVESLVERAATSAPGFSGSGMENALRTEFRSLAKNARKMRTFTPDEQKAIKKVARGGVIENTARNVGKLAPTGVVSGALSGGIGATLGTALGVGPMVGAAVTTSGGFAARRLATALTKRNIKALETLIRTGGDSEMATAALVRSRSVLKELVGRAANIGAAEGAKDARSRK